VRNAEDPGELQLCPTLSFHGVGMVLAWSKNLPLAAEGRLTKRRGHGVWDEGEQPHNVPVSAGNIQMLASAQAARGLHGSEVRLLRILSPARE